MVLIRGPDRKQPEVADWVKLLRQRYGGMKLVVGRDKLDEVQGVRHKLLAFEAFLEKYPEFQGKVSSSRHIVTPILTIAVD